MTGAVGCQFGCQTDLDDPGIEHGYLHGAPSCVTNSSRRRDEAARHQHHGPRAAAASVVSTRPPREEAPRRPGSLIMSLPSSMVKPLPRGGTDAEGSRRPGKQRWSSGFRRGCAQRHRIWRTSWDHCLGLQVGPQTRPRPPTSREEPVPHDAPLAAIIAAGQHFETRPARRST